MKREDLAEITKKASLVMHDIDVILKKGDRYIPDLSAVHARMGDETGQAPDLVRRWVKVPSSGSSMVLAAYIQGLVDRDVVDRDVLAPLLAGRSHPDEWDQEALATGDIQARTSWREILHDLFGGRLLLFASTLPHAWSIGVDKLPSPSITTPTSEQSVTGSNEALSTVLGTQMGQIRRSFRHPGLRFQTVTLGRLQRTSVAIAHLDGLTNPALLASVRQRLERLVIDARPNGNMIADLIRDHPLSIFPTIRTSSRVDQACLALEEGKVLVLVDGDPFALIAPAPLCDFYRTMMDYGTPWYDASFVRLLRLLAWGAGLYLPALYIALTQVNSNLIPSALLIVTVGNHAGLPFTPLVEVVLMIVIIETVREAAIRLPTGLSTTIGTVGAIIVGTVVVRAGIASPQVIFIITLTALSFYTTPAYELTGTWRLINFLLLVGAASMGIYGIVLVTVWLIGTLVGLESFGVPYFEPLAPFHLTDWGDLIVRLPWSLLRNRPTTARPSYHRRLGPSVRMPDPHLRQRP
ncbi:MAG: spore germination protein [Clostridia bacterium]